jgi:hypothetical protein
MKKAMNKLTPLMMSMLLPTKPMSDRLFHMAKKDLNAARSKRSSPVNLLRVANSTISEPAPATPRNEIISLLSAYSEICKHTSFGRFIGHDTVPEVNLDKIVKLTPHANM